MNNTSIIIQREYLERVHKKSFIITTILVPVLMLLLSVLPTAIIFLAPVSTKTVAVIDDSGLIFSHLESSDDVKYVSATGSQESELANDSIYGVLVIERNVMNRPMAKLLTTEAASTTVEQDINHQMQKIIENEKLKHYNITDLDKILEDVSTSVTVQTIRTSDTGEEEGGQSAIMSSVIGTVLNFLLYMFLLMYGSLVMNSIIEEKNNRVLELVVSSVKPSQLMLGKIVGVGLVAVTQIIIWGIILFITTTLIIPALIPAEAMQELQAAQSGNLPVDSHLDPDLAMAFGAFANVGYLAKLFALLTVFLIGGYLFYSAIFAAIGASVDNLQDSSQLQMLGTMPIIIGLIISLAVVPDPNSTFAIIMSMIPFTSPMVMMARVPFGIPGWQIVVSLIILGLSVAFMIWFAAKIYRVGIFMYGKKPTIKDLIRWARYK